MNINVIKYFFRCIINKVFLHIGLFEGLEILIIVCLVLFCVLNCKKIDKKRFCQICTVLCFGLYIVILFQALVINRQYVIERMFIFKCFECYRQIINGDVSVAAEVVLNIVLFVPFAVGVYYFVQVVYKKNIKMSSVLLFGFIMSMCLEVSQLIFKKGFFEIDDLINNTIGCVLGCFIFKKIKKKGGCI